MRIQEIIKIRIMVMRIALGMAAWVLVVGWEWVDLVMVGYMEGACMVVLFS